MGDILDDERKARHRDTVRALYNAVTDHLRELENENERLRGALEKHGAHEPGCKANFVPREKERESCDCGLASALASC